MRSDTDRKAQPTGLRAEPANVGFQATDFWRVAGRIGSAPGTDALEKRSQEQQFVGHRESIAETPDAGERRQGIDHEHRWRHPPRPSDWPWRTQYESVNWNPL